MRMLSLTCNRRAHTLDNYCRRLTSFTLTGTASNMLRQSMVMETQKIEIQRQKTLIQETEFETVAVLDIPKIKSVLGGEDLAEAGYLLQVGF